MFVNFILIVLIFIVISFFGYQYYNKISLESEEEFFEDDYTDLNTIKDKVVREVSAQLKQELREKNMTRKEYETRQRQKATLSRNLKDAAFGDANAKRFIKLYIRSMLIDPNMKMNINEDTIDEIIPFEKEKELKSQDKFEILLYIAYNKMTDEIGRTYKKNGFARIIKDYHLTDPIMVDGEPSYDFTEERLNEVYQSVMAQYSLSYSDKLDILTQRIFEMYKGFGVVDCLSV